MQFLIKLLAVFVVCTVLHASTTHYSPTLRHYFLQQELRGAYQGLWPAAKRGSVDALHALAQLAIVNKDIYWLEKSASLNSVDAMIALAELGDAEQKIAWWTRAARNGHAPSQFELSLIEKNTEQRLRYLEQAALNEYSPAIVALGKYYYDHSEIEQALRWLAKAAVFDEKSRFKLAKMQWRQGFTAKSLSSFEQSSSALPEAKTYYQLIKNTPLSNLSVLSQSSTNGLADNCSQQLQFVATTLDSAVQAAQFKKRFSQDKRFVDFPICINPIVWLKPDQLRCALENDRKRCDLSRLARRQFTPNYTHLVLFLDEGKAYVQNGVMHLDEADVYSVFIHELAHFAGFVDEYAVSAELAQAYCYGDGAPNLAIATKETLKQTETYRLWQSYNRTLNIDAQEKAMTQNAATVNAATVNAIDQNNINQTVLDFDPVPLIAEASRTCAKLGVSTFKPSEKLTFMQYHDANTIPAIYTLMWQDQLSVYHHDVEVAKSLAQSAMDRNDENAARYWAAF